MRLKLPLGLAAVCSLSLLGAGAANASIFHYTFSPGSFYSFTAGVDSPVTGSFDYNTSTGALDNVVYQSISGMFSVGGTYPGLADQLYFGDLLSNYDVYQLTTVPDGSTDIIKSGTHPGIYTYAGGSITTAVAAVPEPATWALMLMGFGVTGYAMRRKSAPAMTFAG